MSPSDPPSAADADRALLMYALRALEEDLKAARDVLEANNASVVRSATFYAYEVLDKSEDGVTRVDRQALAALLRDLANVDEELTEPFADYDWRVARALRDFRSQMQKLTLEETSP